MDEDIYSKRWDTPKGLFDWPKSPSSLPIGQWEQREEELKGNYPIRFFLYDTIPDFLDTIWNYKILRFIKDTKWYILHRFHPKYRYHALDTKLGPGYYDPDIQILHACFETLCTFVEYNQANEVVEWDDKINPETFEAWKEMNKLHNWWRNVRPNRETIFFEDSPEPITTPRQALRANTEAVTEYVSWLELYTKMEEVWAKEDENALIRLMKIRPFLWYS